MEVYIASESVNDKGKQYLGRFCLNIGYDTRDGRYSIDNSGWSYSNLVHFQLPVSYPRLSCRPVAHVPPELILVTSTLLGLVTKVCFRSYIEFTHIFCLYILREECENEAAINQLNI